jgi:hypothetical protein
MRHRITSGKYKPLGENPNLWLNIVVNVLAHCDNRHEPLLMRFQTLGSGGPAPEAQQ